MPGIESRAPERTDTSSGSSGSPRRAAGALLEPGDAVGDLLRQACGLGAAGAHERDARLRA